MSRYPIIQDPYLDEVEKRMRPSGEHRVGFLGNDTRKLIQILTDDQGDVHALGLEDQIIATELRKLIRHGKKHWEGPVVVDDKYRVLVTQARGVVPCPWGDGLFPKTHVEITRLDTNETVMITDLVIHMIETHGFYQGKGSKYRIEPKKIKDFLEL